MNIIFKKAQKKLKELREEVNVLEDFLQDSSVYPWLEGIALELKTNFPSWKSEDIDPQISISGDKVLITLTYFTADVAYEELLDKPGTRMSYNGERLEYDFSEQKLFTNLKATASFCTKLPDSDKEFLKTMNKIVEETSTSLHAVC